MNFQFNDSKERFSINPDFKTFQIYRIHLSWLATEHFPKMYLTWGTDWPNVKINGFIDRKLAISRQFVADPVPTNLEIIRFRGSQHRYRRSGYYSSFRPGW